MNRVQWGRGYFESGKNTGRKGGSCSNPMIVRHPYSCDCRAQGHFTPKLYSEKELVYAVNTLFP